MAESMLFLNVRKIVLLKWWRLLREMCSGRFHCISFTVWPNRTLSTTSGAIMCRRIGRPLPRDLIIYAYALFVLFLDRVHSFAFLFASLCLSHHSLYRTYHLSCSKMCVKNIFTNSSDLFLFFVQCFELSWYPADWTQNPLLLLTSGVTPLVYNLIT